MKYRRGIILWRPDYDKRKQFPRLQMGGYPRYTTGRCIFVVFGEGVTTRMKIERRDGESIEQLLRRFNKVVVAERITKTYREKMQFVSKSEQRKEKVRRAERNRRKKMAQSGH